MVESENPFTGGRQHICKAFFVFVAKPSDGEKVHCKYMYMCISTHQSYMPFVEYVDDILRSTFLHWS